MEASQASEAGSIPVVRSTWKTLVYQRFWLVFMAQKYAKSANKVQILCLFYRCNVIINVKIIRVAM